MEWFATRPSGALIIQSVVTFCRPTCYACGREKKLCSTSLIRAHGITCKIPANELLPIRVRIISDQRQTVQDNIVSVRYEYNIIMYSETSIKRTLDMLEISLHNGSNSKWSRSKLYYGYRTG